jgi:tetratricopeptide (TPR) repeat protein
MSICDGKLPSMCGTGQRLQQLSLALALLASITGQGSAQPVLIRNPSAEATQVRTPQGILALRSTTVQPSDGAVIVLATSLLNSEDLPRIRRELIAAYARLKGNLRLAIYKTGAISSAGPFETRRQFDAALKELQADSTGEPNAERFYWQFPLAVESLAPDGNWSSVILVARFPALDPDVQTYIATHLIRRAAQKKIRLGFWDFGEALPSVIESVATATGGATYTPAGTLLDWWAPKPSTFVQWNWDVAPWKLGFRLYALEFLSATGAVLLSLPGSDTSPTGLPDVDQFRAYTTRLADLKLSGTPEQAAAAEFVLAINPAQLDALRVAARLAAEKKQYQQAAAYWRNTLDLEPSDKEALADLGHMYFAAGDYDAAEPVLRKAYEQKIGGTRTAEDLVQILIQAARHKEALPLLEQVLATEPKRQDLWILSAGSARATGAWQQETQFLEKALQTGSLPFEVHKRLMNVYVEHDAPRNCSKPSNSERAKRAGGVGRHLRPPKAAPAGAGALADCH